MVEKTKLSPREAYIAARIKTMENHLKGMTKDNQIKELKKEYAEARADVRLALGCWGDSIKNMRFHLKISMVDYLVVFLLGVAWGIMIFA